MEIWVASTLFDTPSLFNSESLYSIDKITSTIKIHHSDFPLRNHFKSNYIKNLNYTHTRLNPLSYPMINCPYKSTTYPPNRVTCHKSMTFTMKLISYLIWSLTTTILPALTFHTTYQPTSDFPETNYYSSHIPLNSLYINISIWSKLTP